MTRCGEVEKKWRGEIQARVQNKFCEPRGEKNIFSVTVWNFRYHSEESSGAGGAHGAVQIAIPL